MTAKQLKAFQLRLSGNTYADIAKNVGMSEFTLRHYFSSKGKWHDEYKKWSRIEIEDIQLNAHTILIHHSIEAAKLIANLMYCDKPNVALRAAESVLDRAGFTKNRVSILEQDHSIDFAEEITRWFEMKENEYENGTSTDQGR